MSKPENVNMQDFMQTVLKRAQDTYGFANQLTVATEELCELAAVLSKYPRYPNHELASEKIREKVIEEMADVIICLEHIYMIFKVQDAEIDGAIESKIERLTRWLNASDSQYQTTVDRELKTVESKRV